MAHPLNDAPGRVKTTSFAFLLILSLPCAAQTTCNTDPQGNTLCSTPAGVIRGTTSSIGQSIYRDERGNQLEYDVDPLGKASVQLPTGESIDWSQPLPVNREKPLPGIRRPLPGSPTGPLAPGSPVVPIPPGLEGRP